MRKYIFQAIGNVHTWLYRMSNGRIRNSINNA